MKIVLTFSSLHPHLPKKAAAIKPKRVRDANGKRVTLRTIDANSKEFGRDLGAIFQRNVKKARSSALAKTAAKRGATRSR